MGFYSCKKVEKATAKDRGVEANFKVGFYNNDNIIINRIFIQDYLSVQ